MRVYIAISLVLLPSFATADYYKWLGPDGRIHYSDRPVAGAEFVGIQVDRDAKVTVVQPPGEEGSSDPGPYGGFEIVDPEPNQTLRSAEGKVKLSLLIDPPLSADHRLQILLDGQLVSGNKRETQLLLRGIAFGSHRVQARIVDGENAVIASTPVIDFHLRKPLPEDVAGAD